MTTQIEPVFGGVPAIPAPEVFEQARRNNPHWYQVIEQGYAQFVARPENAGVYADPKGQGATIQQMWMVFTLFGILPYCVLARPLAADKTQRITRLVAGTPPQLVDALKKLQAAAGEINVQIAYHDGATGHCIRITAYDPARDRFIYHDPWPERSLLAKENNPAGVDAQPEGSRWSVTAQELERVVFAAFFFPPQWARVQGQAFEIGYDAWKTGELFKFFRLHQLDEQADDRLVRRVFAPGAFKQQIALVVGVSPATGVIKEASLRIQRTWLVANFPLALDLAKSFVTCFTPPPDQAAWKPIADTLRSMRNPAVMQKVKDADPDESDAIRCAQAFMGRASADVMADFGHLSAGSGAQDGQPVQFIDILLY